jgi:hypothetical protein
MTCVPDAGVFENCFEGTTDIDSAIVWSKTGLFDFEVGEICDDLAIPNSLTTRIVKITGTNEYWMFARMRGLGCDQLNPEIVWGTLWKESDTPPDCYDIDNFELPFFCLYDPENCLGGKVVVSNSVVRVNAI